MTHPRHLQRMQIVHGTDALDGLDHGIVLDFSHLHDTGTNRFSIHDYRTSTALSLITSDLTTCQQQLLAQTFARVSSGFTSRVRGNPLITSLFLIIRIPPSGRTFAFLSSLVAEHLSLK